MDKSKAIVILGTAHLITTPGKRSPDGMIREPMYSREIVRNVYDELTRRGYRVFVDYMPLDPNSQMVSQDPKVEQNRELEYRVSQVNSLCGKYGNSNCIYVSIHVNAFGTQGKWESPRGWSIYTSPGKTKADDLASAIWNVANEILPHDHKNAIRADWGDKDADFEARYYVLTKTKCAAVLTENFFQDNQDDVNYLLSLEGRTAIVRLHVEGIINYLNSL